MSAVAQPEASHDRVRDLFAGASVEMNGRDAKVIAAADLPAGARVAVTWLPRETMAQRIEAAAGARAAGFAPMPHIAARYFRSHAELDAALMGFADVGVTRVFVIAGDTAVAKGPFPDALSIVRSGALERAGVREVGVAFYPEAHPSIGAATLERAFSDKVEAIAKAGAKPFLMTQFCFSAAAILATLDCIDVLAPGIEVRVGLAGPTHPAALAKFALRCGVALLAKHAGAAARLLTAPGPEDLVAELARDPRFASRALHFFTFGGLKRTTRWVNAIANGRPALR